MFIRSGVRLFGNCFATISPLIVVTCLALPCRAASEENLLSNPGAETGDISGWIDPDDAWGASDEVTPRTGDYFFWPVRKAMVSTEMYQDVAIDLSGTEDTSYMHLSAWLCNWDQYPHDRSTLAIEALDASGTTLAYHQSEQRSPIWTRHIIEAPVPTGTQTIRVHLIATRFVGTDNDGYFDDLLLTVDQQKNAAVTITSEDNKETVDLDGQLQLTATTSGAVDDEYVWSSSFPSIATIDSNGTVSGVSEGRVVIMARGVESNAVGNFEVQVIDQDAVVFISPKTDTMLIASNEIEVLWDVVGTPGTGSLSLSLDGGVNFTVIENDIDLTSGELLWTPNELETTQRQCVLKIEWGSSEALSGIFTIIPSSGGPVLVREREVSTQSLTHGDRTLVFDLKGRLVHTNNHIIRKRGVPTPFAAGIQLIHKDGKAEKTAILSNR